MNLELSSLHELLSGLKEKKFSATELTKLCLQRIRRHNKDIKAFVTVCEKEALSEARAADSEYSRGVIKPLLGIPVAMKDNFCTKGIRTTASSNVLKDYVPVYDATVVVRLKEAGAVIVGKTNMDAWAHGSSTETSDFFTTHNPWDLTKLPGGSSGGSGAAVAAGLVPMAIGSETAGSIRQPASWCGVCGLKPTYGRVSRYGVIAMASSTDSPGPIARYAEDAALALEVIAGQDGQDATLSPRPIEKYFSQAKKSLSKISIGIPRQYLAYSLEPGTKKLFKKAMAVFSRAGFTVETVDLLDPAYSIAVYTLIQRSEVSSNLARYDGIRYGQSRELFGEEAKRRIMLGTYALSAGYYDQYYAKAQKVRTKLMEDFTRVFSTVDLLMAPTCPTVALPIGATKDQAMFGELQDALVEASSLCGLPGISIPCGFDQKLPVGLQIFGPQFSESTILQAAHFYQSQTDWHRLRPKAFS